MEEDPNGVRERLARVEARLDSLDAALSDVKDSVEKIDNRTWLILASVVLSVLLALLKLF